METSGSRISEAPLRARECARDCARECARECACVGARECARVRARARGPVNGNSGFTLLEILVVMTIVAILTGTVILGFTGTSVEQDLKGAAQRMAMRVELARQQALQRNREWGIFIRDDGYEFAEFDPDQGAVDHLGKPPVCAN